MLLKEQNLREQKAGLNAAVTQLAAGGVPQPLQVAGAEKELDPRVKRTRQLLVQAFIDLLSEKDFQSLTVQDITERATVNRATFYAHFEDKYALHDYVVRENFQLMLHNRLSVSYELTVDNLRQLTLTAFEFLEQFHNHCNRLRSRREPLVEIQVQALLYEFLLDWFKQLKSNEIEQPETVASAISWAIFGVALEWSRGSKKQTAQATVNRVITLVTTGLPYLADSKAVVS